MTEVIERVIIKTNLDDFAMELSHPNDKNKNVVRVGHPKLCGVLRIALLVSWYPTHSAKKRGMDGARSGVGQPDLGARGWSRARG